MEAQEKLVMSFQPNTIQHLGVKMYSTVPPALAELIANAYDACSTEVKIDLIDSHELKIIVSDNGVGMSFDEVNAYFLRIGRNRRDENQETSCSRQPTGKKGLGKLALFGLGDNIEIKTTKDGQTVVFYLDWKEIQNWKGANYEPKFKRLESKNEEQGTSITLTNLKRKTGFPINDYIESISKLFDFQDNFQVLISLNGSEPVTIDNKTKYSNITTEFEWDIKEIIAKNENDYQLKDEIAGKIVTTEKPLKPHLRGITLFANGRLINAPEFFVDSDSSHFYSYATGWLNVDFLDNLTEDVIATNRQSIDWENPDTMLLREYLASCILIIEREWREKRKAQKQRLLKEKTNVDVERWYATLPENVQGKVETIVNIVDNAAQIPEDEQQETIEMLHQLVPEYPNLHWRNLKTEIREVSEKYYQNKDYYTAFIEALKRYISEVRKKSGSTNTSERSMMGEVFSGRKLCVTKKFKKTDGTDFTQDTIANIEAGQHFLSEGIVIGGRHPLQHEEHLELSKTGLFSEKDCLDFLSLLSHLVKRLNDSESP